MTRSITIFALLLGLAGAGATAAGCDLFLGDTKTSKGVLYTSGDQRYDPYFDQVHKEQLAAANWPDEAKQSRKPIVDALSVKPDASNSTIFSATKDMKSSPALAGPVEQTTTAETDRARRMNAEAKRLEDIRDHGDALRKQAASDRENMGAQKADDKAVAHKDEVKRELGAAVDALGKMIDDAQHNAHEAEELASKLTAAYTGHPEDEKKIDTSAAPSERKPAPPTSASASASAAPPKKPPKPAAPKTAPNPAPAPAPKPPPEDFNP